MSSQSGITLASLRDKFRKALRAEGTYVNNILTTLEAKTKFDREYIAFGVIGFIVLYLIVGWGNDFVCNLIGFLYPAYASVKAIESPLKDDDTKWLMYWCVYALFGILEFFSDHILFWIPFYTLNKCFFLLWLMVPGQNGGTYMIYNRVIRPFVIKHQSTIDKAVNNAKDAAGKITNDYITKSD